MGLVFFDVDVQLEGGEPAGKSLTDPFLGHITHGIGLCPFSLSSGAMVSSPLWSYAPNIVGP